MIARYDYIKKVLVRGDHYVPTEVKAEVAVDVEEVRRVIEAHTGDVVALSGIKGVVNEDVYAVLCYVYNTLLRQRAQDVPRVVMCVAHLAGLKPKEVGGTGSVSIVDIVFNMIVHIAQIIGKDMHRYVLVSREVMYFRSTKKNIGERLRLLYVTLYVLGGGAALDVRKLVKPRSRGPVDTDYLYVLCERDDGACKEVQQAAEVFRRRRHMERHKDVVVGYTPPEGVDIVKMSW